MIFRVVAALALALRAITRAKVRAALTVLGILIGVAAVVIVTALGKGVQAQVEASIKTMGSNSIFVFPQANQSSGARARPGQGGRLTESDARAILREAASVAKIVPFLSAQAQIMAGERNVATSVMGTWRAYFDVRGFTLAQGDAWSETDETLKTKVVVLGATVKERLFGGADAVGAIVRIGRHAYRVVGVLAQKGQSPSGEDQDDRVVMPSGTWRAHVSPTPPGRVQMLIASAAAPNVVDRAQAQIESILRQRHQLGAEDEPDFGIRTQAEFLRMQEQIFGTLRLLLVGIALVSLGVGGIGVMNIMLVSVAERTREIGIRMAIGAREGDILVQFLVEAVALCLAGGVAGTALAVLAIGAFARALEWSMPVPLEALALALGTSFSVGLAFGFWPARRAARLDPIDALRHE